MKTFPEKRYTRANNPQERFAFPHNTCLIRRYGKSIPPLDKLLFIGDGLTVSESGIPNAGSGLFATQPIKQNQIITWYQGAIFGSSIGKERNALLEQESGKNQQYLCTINNSFSINGIVKPVRGAGGGSFANHFPFSNAKLERASDCDGVFLKAKRSIAKGQEILISYEQATLVRMGIKSNDEYFLKNTAYLKEVGGTFKCPICDEGVGENLIPFRKHFYSHKKEKGPVCDECGKEFFNSSNLCAHKLTHSNEKPFQCEQCEKYFSKAGNLKIHHRNIHNKVREKFQCEKCFKSYKSKRAKNFHFKYHHTNAKGFQCLECKRTFPQENHYKNHNKAHISVIGAKGKYCPKTFPGLKDMEEHKKTKRYDCSYCSKSFTIHYYKMVHERIDTGEKPYSCGVCSKSLRISAAKKQHELTHTGESYKCKHCSKSFATSQYRKLHERIHTGDKPYKCNYCSMSFSFLGNKGRHERIHTEEKPFKCEYCRKKFAQNSIMTDHINKEHKEKLQKPHQCEYCQTRFTQKNNMKRHILTHTKEKPQKPHQCEYCQKRFTQKSNMKRHMLTHTKEKPHQCEICKKCFALKQTMTRHISTHTNNKTAKRVVKVTDH